MLVEVTTRPVFVLQGELPMYRRMVIGTEGPDVGPARTGARCGSAYDPGTVDTVFDAATAAAVEQMYADAAYAAEGPSDEQRDELTTAREAVTAARAGRDRRPDGAWRTPRSRCPSRSACSSSRRSTALGRPCPTPRPTPGEHASCRTSRSPAPGPPATRPAPCATRPSTVRDAASAPGAIDPDTGEPYTPERIAALDVAAAEAQQAYTQAEGELVIAEQARTSAIAAADGAIDDAAVQLQIAEAQLAEGMVAGDTGPLQEAVAAAEAGAGGRPDRAGRAGGRRRHSDLPRGDRVRAGAACDPHRGLRGARVGGRRPGRHAHHHRHARACPRRPRRCRPGRGGRRGRDRDPRRRRHRAGQRAQRR